MQTRTQVLTFKVLHLNLASFGIQTARRLHKQVPSEKAYVAVAFTVNDSADPIFFAGPETDSRCHNDMSGGQDPRRKLFLFVSGQTTVGAPASFDPVKPESYPAVTVIVRREQEHRWLNLCDLAVGYKTTSQLPESPYLKKALDHVEAAEQRISEQMAEQATSPVPVSLQHSPFEQLGRWLRGDDYTKYTEPTKAKEALFKEAPSPYSDAEQHAAVSLFDPQSAAGVQHAMLKRSTEIKTVFCHMTLNLECCDFCGWMLLHGYYRFKEQYADKFDADFFLVISWHARYYPLKYTTKGLKAMLQGWPDEYVRNHVILMPDGLTVGN